MGPSLFRPRYSSKYDYDDETPILSRRSSELRPYSRYGSCDRPLRDDSERTLYSSGYGTTRNFTPGSSLHSREPTPDPVFTTGVANSMNFGPLGDYSPSRPATPPRSYSRSKGGLFPSSPRPLSPMRSYSPINRRHTASSSLMPKPMYSLDYDFGDRHTTNYHRDAAQARLEGRHLADRPSPLFSRSGLPDRLRYNSDRERHKLHEGVARSRGSPVPSLRASDYNPVRADIFAIDEQKFTWEHRRDPTDAERYEMLHGTPYRPNPPPPVPSKPPGYTPRRRVVTEPKKKSFWKRW